PRSPALPLSRSPALPLSRSPHPPLSRSPHLPYHKGAWGLTPQPPIVQNVVLIICNNCTLTVVSQKFCGIATAIESS
ncbi:MAG: hypothetical protein SW833_18240, partial [Cyanobacteriota bacterium]|nr:hypothetical protein [Cyanobacteriota bacterium]